MILAIIQSRMGSSRLPGKAMALIHGHPLIQHVIDRVQQIRQIDQVVVAIPEADDQTALGAWLRYVPKKRFSYLAVGGVDERDVLGRFVAVANQYPSYDTILRITGDCPLLDPRIAEQVIDLYTFDVSCHYAWNVVDGYVDGEDVEVFSAAVLRRAHREATDLIDREHVTPYIRRHFTVATLQPDSDRSSLKTSVDTREDLERVRALMSRESLKELT